MPYPWFHAHASPCSRHLGIPVVFAYASVPSAWGRRETFSATIQVGYSVVPQVNKAAALQGQNMSLLGPKTSGVHLPESVRDERTGS